MFKEEALKLVEKNNKSFLSEEDILEALKNAYQKGFTDGENENTQSFDQGYANGYEDGELNGYDVGYRDAEAEYT